MKLQHPTPYALILDEKRRQPEKNKMDAALKSILEVHPFITHHRDRQAGERRLLSSNSTLGEYRKKGR